MANRGRDARKYGVLANRDGCRDAHQILILAGKLSKDLRVCVRSSSKTDQASSALVRPECRVQPKSLALGGYDHGKSEAIG
ncbi:hypothetical protein GCM10027568_01200 [Humibacter soli]